MAQPTGVGTELNAIAELLNLAYPTVLKAFPHSNNLDGEVVSTYFTFENVTDKQNT